MRLEFTKTFIFKIVVGETQVGSAPTTPRELISRSDTYSQLDDGQKHQLLQTLLADLLGGPLNCSDTQAMLANAMDKLSPPVQGNKRVSPRKIERTAAKRAGILLEGMGKDNLKDLTEELAAARV